MKEFENLDLGYVARYTFGIGFAISIPLILVALSVDDIGDFFRSGTLRSQQWFSRKDKSAPTTDRVEGQLQALEIEKIISMARTRRSGDSRLDYGPSLLPVSTRGSVATRPPPESLYANGLAPGLVRKSYEVRRSVEYRPYT